MYFLQRNAGILTRFRAVLMFLPLMTQTPLCLFPQSVFHSWLNSGSGLQWIFQELSEGMTYFAKRARQLAFCAQCILKQHAKHRVDEYCTFR